MTLDRLVRHEDLPPERVHGGRDLREHAQEGLEVELWDRTYPRDGQMSAHLP